MNSTSLDPSEDDFRCPACECVNIVGVEVTGEFFGILYWECRVCGSRWHRWPEGHYLHLLADPYLYRPEPHPAHATA
jgi:hypothetical protein